MNLKNYTMLSKKVEDTLSKQIKIEGESSQIYLAMACWAEFKGLEGVSNFMYEYRFGDRWITNRGHC